MSDYQQHAVCELVEIQLRAQLTTYAPALI